MAAHVVTLYDEIHRTFYLFANLNNDSNYREVRVGQDAQGHYLFLLSAAGSKTTIRLRDIKIPPSTGLEAEDIFKGLAEKFNHEFKSLL